MVRFSCCYVVVVSLLAVGGGSEELPALPEVAHGYHGDHNYYRTTTLTDSPFDVGYEVFIGTCCKLKFLLC